MLVTTNYRVNPELCGDPLLFDDYATPVRRCPVRGAKLYPSRTSSARAAYDPTMLHPAAVSTAALLLGRALLTGALLVVAALVVRRR